MKELDDYNDSIAKVHEYFGYVEDWCAIPIEDSREYYWRLDGDGPSSVWFAEDAGALDNEDSDDVYRDEIWTQRFLPKWVYRGAEYTMIVVDTHIDGNKVLRIFENAKER